MKLITVSGIDKSGKTTVIKEFMNVTNYKHYIIDRDPSNYQALNFIRKRVRKGDKDEYYEFIDFFRHNVDLAILLVVDKETGVKRFEDSDEPKLPGKYSFEKHQEIISKYFYDVGYRNSITINTSELSVEQTIELIIEKLEEDNASK